MSARLHQARWGVREHLRPKTHHPASFGPSTWSPRFKIQVWVGGSSPGREWDGPTDSDIPLGEALALPVAGEA